MTRTERRPRKVRDKETLHAVTKRQLTKEEREDLRELRTYLLHDPAPSPNTAVQHERLARRFSR
jgi:hypothetical protein